MFNLTISTIIESPIKHVFNYMSTPENNIQWQYGTLASATITSRNNGMGVYFRSIGHFLGHRNLGTYKVVESSSNQKYRFKSLSGSLYLQTTYTFEAAGNATKVNISIRVGAVNFSYMNERLLERRMKQQLRENLSMLKDILEVRRISPAPEPNLLLT